MNKLLSYARFRLRQSSVRMRRPGLIRRAFEHADQFHSIRSSATKSALLLPTASPGNLGDEALFVGTVAELRSQGFERICVISFGEDQKYEIKGAETVVLQLHHNPVGEAYLQFVNLATDFSHFFVWGADIVDGTHGAGVVLHRQTLANLAARLGIKVTICSFSVSNTRSRDAMDGYRSLHPDVRLFCRDAFSKERLDSEVGDRKVELSADLAFLLRPNHETELSRQVRHWTQQQRAEQKIIFGLNINDLFCSYFDIAPDDLLNYYASALRRLTELVPPFALIHLPHDTHPNQDLSSMTDFSLARQLNSMLPDELSSTAFIPSESMTAPEVRSICTNVDLIFSARMHLSIASLAVGTPVFGLAYQGKFEGLFRHFGLEDMYLTVDQIRDSETSAQFLAQAFERSDSIGEQVKSRLPGVLQLSRANIEL